MIPNTACTSLAYEIRNRFCQIISNLDCVPDPDQGSRAQTTQESTEVMP